MMQYTEVPEEFATRFKDRERRENIFNYARTIDGRYVMPFPNALEEFPGLFNLLRATGWEPQPISLTAEDFPPQEFDPEAVLSDGDGA